MAKEIVVLAYSGGLDTSVCIKWLQEEYGLDVVALVGDVGQEHVELEVIKEKALKHGAIACEVIDMKEEFANDYLTKALAANAMYENKYPLLSALSRPLISKHLVEYAHKYGAGYIAHGCTGKGNDQVRFEASVMMLDPSLKIIAPLREWSLKTRSAEIEWAHEHGIDVPVTKESPYSIDSNLWGRAIECGCLEDPWVEPPEEIYTMTVSPLLAPDEPEYVELEFKAGIPCALNGTAMGFLELINSLEAIAAKNGY
ncbi:MAG: argininosuccinate synthase, partial [Eggerthellaceae bacterium]|nr:argininosuccinate synthase [Eggerthellaceae bacterium]